MSEPVPTNTFGVNPEKPFYLSFDFLGESNRQSTSPTIAVEQKPESVGKVLPKTSLAQTAPQMRSAVWVAVGETEFPLPLQDGRLQPVLLEKQYDDLVEAIYVLTGEQELRNIVLQLLLRKWSLLSKEQFLENYGKDLEDLGPILSHNLSVVQAKIAENFSSDLKSVQRLRSHSIFPFNVVMPNRVGTRNVAFFDIEDMFEMKAARLGMAGTDTFHEVKIPPATAMTTVTLATINFVAAYKRLRKRSLDVLRSAELGAIAYLSALADQSLVDVDAQFKAMFQVHDNTPLSSIFENESTPFTVKPSVLEKILEAFRGIEDDVKNVVAASKAEKAARRRLTNAMRGPTSKFTFENWPDAQTDRRIFTAEKILEGRSEELDKFRANFAIKRAKIATEWPVVARISAEAMFAILLKPTLLQDKAGRAFRNCYTAANKLRHDTATWKRGFHFREKAEDARRDIEFAFADRIDDLDKSCWIYSKIFQPVAYAFGWFEDSFESRLLRKFSGPLQEREKENRIIRLVSSAAETVELLAITVVNPPLGFVLGIILSSRDLYFELEQYDDSVMKYWVTIDPKHCLSDTPPDELAVAFALAGLAASFIDIEILKAIH